MAKEKIIASLDIGNYKIKTLVGIISPEKKGLQIIGIGNSYSSGMRKGNIIDVEETINSISSSLEDAEKMCGEPINHVFVGISGSHIECFASKGVIAISGDEIVEDDVDRLLETAQAISIPNNRKILKIIPRNFIIDGQEGIRYPVGMVGKKLEVEAHIITALTPNIKNIEKCIHESGVDIDDIIPNVIASPEAILSKRQKELGVVVVDIGAGSTNMSVYEEGSLIYAKVLPIGGENVTNDVAIGLRTSIDIAEKIKIEYGSCMFDENEKNAEIDLSTISKLESQKVSKQHLIEIIEARYYEIFSLVKKELKNIGKDGMLPGGAVLTGGGAKISGILEVSRNTLNLPVQIGVPNDFEISLEKIDDPSFSNVYGVLLWGSKFEPSFSSFSVSLNIFKDVFDKLKGWFKKLLP